MYENTSRYENILTSITLNLYKYNFFLNLSETPYFRDRIGDMQIGEHVKFSTTIYRKIRTIYTAGFYKEINNFNTLVGLAFLPRRNIQSDDLVKYFIQLTIKLN